MSYKLKRGSNETSFEYIERLNQDLSPIQKVLLSGDELSLSDIIAAWNKPTISPFWKNRWIYNNIELFFYIYLQEKYKTTKKVAILFGNSRWFINYRFFSIPLSAPKPLSVQSDEIHTYKDFEENIQKHIVNRETRLIVVPLVFRRSKGNSGHALIVIINKYLKTIEYYDSNGSKQYHYTSSSYRYIVDGYDRLRDYFMSFEWYRTDGYRFLSVDETNVYKGIQSYGDGSIMESILPSKLRKIGWCMMYSLMIVHYRIYYYKVEPIVLQRILLSKMIGSGDKQVNVVRFLLNYLLYIMIKVQSPELMGVLKHDYPEYEPSFLESFWISQHITPYVIRRN